MALGAEYVEAQVYKSLGLTEADMAEYFPGPAFLAWHEMSDMDGKWSGPLSSKYRADRAAMANETLDMMLNLGMKPVLQAFGGHVPCELKRIYPNTTFAPRQTWQGFNSSCLLSPHDPLFKTLAQQFYAVQKDTFEIDSISSPLINGTRSPLARTIWITFSRPAMLSTNL